MSKSKVQLSIKLTGAQAGALYMENEANKAKILNLQNQIKGLEEEIEDLRNEVSEAASRAGDC